MKAMAYATSPHAVGARPVLLVQPRDEPGQPVRRQQQVQRVEVGRLGQGELVALSIRDANTDAKKDAAQRSLARLETMKAAMAR